MEPLIYYPTFEPPDETWLKFALLYFESFKPIVPHDRRYQLSDNFKRIMDNSDLVTLYSPEYDQGYRASLYAIEEAEKFLSNPYERSYLFKEVNLARKWRKAESWNFEIYKEKFSNEWLDFCRGNDIGFETGYSILLPEELAFIFMSYLAKEIAFEQSAAIITDNNSFDSFTNYSRGATPLSDRRNKFSKSIINLLVPKNLEEISLTKVLKFRKDNRKLIKAFNDEIDNVQEKISQGYSQRDFINRYNDIYSNVTSEIIKFGIGIAAIPFGVYALVENPNALTVSYVKEVLGAMGFMVGGTYGLHKGLRDTKTKRYCKKYITNLERLR